jgi:two-component system sensor histidine kinase/response regulator
MTMPESPPATPQRPRASRMLVAIDDEISREIRELKARRLAAESPFSEIAHIVLVATCGAAALPYAQRGDVIRWVVAVTAAALFRGWLRLRSQRDTFSADAILRSIRLGVIAIGIGWGAGILLVGPDLPLDRLAWTAVVFAGLIAGATVSLLPDPMSFYMLTATLILPLTGALLRHGNTDSHWYGAFVTLVFGMAMSVYYRRSHKALLEQFVIAKRLELTERAAGQERAMLDALIEGAPNAIAVMADDGTILRVNRGFEAVFGFKTMDAEGRDLNLTVVPAEEREAAREIDRRVQSGEKVVTEVRRVRRDGTSVWVRISATTVTTHGERVTFVIYDDVTETRRAREAEHSLVRIIEATTDHVSMASPDGTLRYLNRAGRVMLGIPDDEDLSNANLLDLCPPALRDVIWHERMPALMRAGSWQGESAFLHRDGHEVPVSLVALAQRGAGGQVESLATVARDVTEEVARREALQSARDAAEDATNAKSALLANTSHEIRTPLNGILGMVELLLDTELTPAQRRSVELIQSSGESLLGTMNDLLDLSKLEASNLELEVIDYDLHHVLNSVGRLFMPRASQRGVELLIDVQGAVPQFVRGDPHRLRQVLSNLVGNAIKFTAKGEIVLSARVAKETPGRVSLRFAVRDTGIGIAKEHLQRIFEPFRQVDASTTRQYGGTGLGLSIARRLVNLMGDDLGVDSTVGEGSEFHFVVDAPVSAEDSTRSQKTVELSQLRVLVVDDHPTNRRILGEMLRWAGCVCEEVVDVASALNALREAQRGKAPFRLVVSDVQMPNRDGFQLAEGIRADAAMADTRVMLLTSAGKRGDGQRCRALGVAAYLQKPVSRVELIEAAVAAMHETVPGAHRPSLVTRHTIDETRKRLRVLVAEDNAVNQEVALAMLRKRGHDVQIVSDGRAAVNAVAAGPAFDVILMDIQMPELDGIRATKEIRASGNITPIVALTANVLPSERERCFEAGMNGYLSKPFKAHELFGAIEGWTTPDPALPSENASPDPVNLTTFREMLRDADIESTGDQMLRVFLEYSGERVGLIDEAVKRNDAGEIERVAHMLKSGSGTIHAHGLAELFRRAESAAQSGDMETLKTLAADISIEYARVVAFLHKELAAQE